MPPVSITIGNNTILQKKIINDNTTYSLLSPSNNEFTATLSGTGDNITSSRDHFILQSDNSIQIHPTIPFIPLQGIGRFTSNFLKKSQIKINTKLENSTKNVSLVLLLSVNRNINNMSSNSPFYLLYSDKILGSMQEITFTNSGKRFSYNGGTYSGMSNIANDNDVLITPDQEWVIQIIPTDVFPQQSYSTFENNYNAWLNGNATAEQSSWMTRVIDGTISMGNNVKIDYIGAPATVQSCFLENTLVNTDQGRIQISKINPAIHSIRNMEIKSVIKSTLMDNDMIFIEKDALYKNVPCENTYITQYHKLYYNKQFIKAYELVAMKKATFKNMSHHKNVYNILLEDHNKMIINNLIVETQDPNSFIGKLYNNFILNKSCKKQDIIEAIEYVSYLWLEKDEDATAMSKILRENNCKNVNKSNFKQCFKQFLIEHKKKDKKTVKRIVNNLI